MKHRKTGLIYRLIDLLAKCIDYILLKKKIVFLRIIKRILLSLRSELIYLIEEANWAIEWVGKYTTHNLNKLYSIKAEIGTQFLAKRKILHFGSITCLIRDFKLINLNKSNQTILTWYHINPEDDLIKFIPILNKRLDLIQTSNEIAKRELIQYGFNENKVVIVPLGVDLIKFKRFNEKKRLILRKKLNLPEEKTIIGSFQQDCWKGGIPIKRKGPDIFCEVVKKLNKRFNIHILLLGPERLYIKRCLDENKIPYTHLYETNYNRMVYYYNVLDIYLITSRSEGGPLALLESMASGVPVVSTKVGMAPEIINNNINGFIAEIDDVERLFQYSTKLIEDKELKEKIIQNALNEIKEYSWDIIIKKYFKNIYKCLKFNCS